MNLVFLGKFNSLLILRPGSIRRGPRPTQEWVELGTGSSPMGLTMADPTPGMWEELEAIHFRHTSRGRPPRSGQVKVEDSKKKPDLSSSLRLAKLLNLPNNQSMGNQTNSISPSMFLEGSLMSDL